MAKRKRISQIGKKGKRKKRITKKTFRQESLSFETKKYGKFTIEIYRGIEKKTKAGKRLRYQKIAAKDFKPGKQYRVFIKHNKTRFRRLLATGKLRDIPIRTKIPELFGRLLGGRVFKPVPLPKKGKGKWLPTHRIIGTFEKELSTLAEETGAEVRAAIIPPMRYYHSGWKIFSNDIIKGTQKVHHLMVNAVTLFQYPRIEWYGKQSFYVTLDRPVMLRNLDSRHGDKIKQAAEDWADTIFPEANAVRLMDINGYIPLPGKPKGKK